ncbi:hypothetical protein BOTBODRAFT_60871 [Botryobasidium botryosum FD-172 SS1]|uniref:Uncharacterized protein n=1 Tax=Botryobasidium botryosum (strain FD-172 SS1) TaxID=930990 RepID=A0A067M2G5_BOTB1|nr:hypothetical protein BOTBODRAFT_60871 [Botryobasidium botryosum FD-172 SS1]
MRWKRPRFGPRTSSPLATRAAHPSIIDRTRTNNCKDRPTCTQIHPFADHRIFTTTVLASPLPLPHPNRPYHTLWPSDRPLTRLRALSLTYRIPTALLLSLLLPPRLHLSATHLHCLVALLAACRLTSLNHFSCQVRTF